VAAWPLCRRPRFAHTPRQRPVSKAQTVAQVACQKVPLHAAHHARRRVRPLRHHWQPRRPNPPLRQQHTSDSDWGDFLNQAGRQWLATATTCSTACAIGFQLARAHAADALQVDPATGAHSVQWPPAWRREKSHRRAGCALWRPQNARPSGRPNVPARRIQHREVVWQMLSQRAATGLALGRTEPAPHAIAPGTSPLSTAREASVSCTVLKAWASTAPAPIASS
jgi:hypothetical protein